MIIKSVASLHPHRRVPSHLGSPPFVSATALSQQTYNNIKHIIDMADQNKSASGPVELLKVDHALRLARTTSQDNPFLPPSAAAMHESNTTTPEMSNILSRLTYLEKALAHQIHLNELHEAHTAKNFHEQRRLNADRKSRIRETLKIVDEKFAKLDAQRMGQERVIKQLEVRANSHGLQLSGLSKRVEMLANAGEWMERECQEVGSRCDDLRAMIEEMQEDKEKQEERCDGLRKDIDQLTIMKEDLSTRVESLSHGYKLLKRRLSELEKRMDVEDERKFEFQVMEDMGVEFGLNVAAYAVGNYRCSTMYHWS
ncbi:hypothetical protein E4T43_08641 [Aureobasidium subglaciale]|nr:hypothetical protein E4T43_08641 [Aureobasidium subglaciale]